MTSLVLSDITLTNDSAVAQVNNSDSLLGIVPKSLLFVDNRNPVVVLAVNTQTQVITLTSAWPHPSVANVAATVVYLGGMTQMLDAVAAIQQTQATYTNLITQLKTYGTAPILTASIAASSYALNASEKTTYQLTLNQASTTLSCPLRTDTLAHELTLKIIQGSGANAVVWQNILWPQGSPVLSSAAGKFDLVRLLVTNTEIIGTVLGVNY